MASPLRELLALFSISVNTEELEEANKKVEGFTGKLKLVGETLVEALAVHEVKAFFTEQIENAAHLKDLSNRLQISTTSINEFGFAAKSVGVDVDAAAHMLGRFQRTLGEAAVKGGEAGQEMRRFGIDAKTAAKQDTIEVITKLADGFAKLPTQAERTRAAVKLFGREGLAMTPLLAKGGDALREMFGEARALSGGLGDDFYESAKKAAEEGEHFTFALETLKNLVLTDVLPLITPLLTLLKDWTKDVINLTTRTNILKALMLSFALVAGVKLLSTLQAFGITLRALAVTFGILEPTIAGTASALLRFAMPLLLAAALYLVFDELYTLMTGGKTIIGDTLDELFGLGTAAGVGLELNAVFKDTFNLLKDVGIVLEDTLLGALDTVLASLGAVGVALKDIVTMNFGDIGKDVKQQFTTGPFAPQKRGQGILDAGARIFGGADTKNLEDLNTMMAAGVDPRMLQAGAMGHVTYGAGMATREGIVAQNTNNPLAHGWRVALPPRKGGKHAGTRVDLKVVNHIHTAQDNHKAIGDAAGMGTASATEKAMNAAHASSVAP